MLENYVSQSEYSIINEFERIKLGNQSFFEFLTKVDD